MKDVNHNRRVKMLMEGRVGFVKAHAMPITLRLVDKIQGIGNEPGSYFDVTGGHGSKMVMIISAFWTVHVYLSTSAKFV